jgi:hypothetical protein
LYKATADGLALTQPPPCSHPECGDTRRQRIRVHRFAG